jgi:2-polyprenyl-3-methyl-5-hydroxy-6-metoxy-1,4-benzoquinol methylase
MIQQGVSSMSDAVRRYFERTSREFDSIHGRGPLSLGGLVDRVFRAGMLEREAYVLGSLRPEGTLLDVGCGGGKYAVALARRGMSATGIDFAEAMIGIARERARQAGVQASCTWIAGDVMALDLPPADAVLAIGVFDYVDEPAKLLARLEQLTRRELIASFPEAGTWQGALRRAWLRLRDCPVRYYDAGELRGLVASWDGEARVVESIRGDYLLHWRR